MYNHANYKGSKEGADDGDACSPGHVESRLLRDCAGLGLGLGLAFVAVACVVVGVVVGYGRAIYCHRRVSQGVKTVCFVLWCLKRYS